MTLMTTQTSFFTVERPSEEGYTITNTISFHAYLKKELVLSISGFQHA